MRQKLRPLVLISQFGSGGQYEPSPLTINLAFSALRDRAWFLRPFSGTYPFFFRINCPPVPFCIPRPFFGRENCPFVHTNNHIIYPFLICTRTVIVCVLSLGRQIMAHAGVGGGNSLYFIPESHKDSASSAICIDRFSEPAHDKHPCKSGKSMFIPSLSNWKTAQ